MDTAETVRKFVIENFIFDENNDLADDTSFLESGIMDSTGVLELVSFIETTFGVNVEDNELVPENLDSIAGVARYVEKKKGGES